MLKTHCLLLKIAMDFLGHPTPGSRQIGDFARAKDTLSVIIVEIDTRIYKTYPKLDLTIVPQLSERYFEFNQ